MLFALLAGSDPSLVVGNGSGSHEAMEVRVFGIVAKSKKLLGEARTILISQEL